MTRKDFELIASVFYYKLSIALNDDDKAAIRGAAYALSNTFENEYQRFDPDKFLTAVTRGL